jgi:hypothetical protein
MLRILWTLFAPRQTAWAAQVDPDLAAITQSGAVPRPLNATEEAALAVAHVMALLTKQSIWYVDSNGNAGDGRTPERPLATINAAIDAAAAGDTIFVLPTHAETVANATTIIPDKDGLSIIGLGRGARRPTITFSHANGNTPISGAGVVLKNFLFTTTGAIDVTAGITVTAEDVLLEDLEYRDALTTSQTVDFIVGAAASDRLHVKGLRYLGLAGDAGAAAVSITAAVDGVIIEDFNIDGTFSAACIENVTGVATNMLIRNGVGRNRHSTQDGIVVCTTTTTGWVNDVDGRAATHDADGFDLQFVGADMQFNRVTAVNLDGESGGDPKTASAAS